MAKPVGYLLSDDLLFMSKIAGVARDQERILRSARNGLQLLELVRLQQPVCLILDLANPGLKLAELLAQLRLICQPLPRLVAYGSHVDVGTLREARKLGCDPVLPRSQFVEQLPVALPDWWQASDTSSAGSSDLP